MLTFGQWCDQQTRRLDESLESRVLRVLRAQLTAHGPDVKDEGKRTWHLTVNGTGHGSPTGAKAIDPPDWVGADE